MQLFMHQGSFYPLVCPPLSLEPSLWSTWVNKEWEDTDKTVSGGTPERGMYRINTHSTGQKSVAWSYLTL